MEAIYTAAMANPFVDSEEGSEPESYKPAVKKNRWGGRTEKTQELVFSQPPEVRRPEQTEEQFPETRIPTCRTELAEQNRRSLEFKKIVKRLKKQEKLRDQAERFYCPNPGCMWEKEDKEESEGDEDKWLQEIGSYPSPYKWPCPQCEDQMIGDNHTPYSPIGYINLTKQEIAEIKKREKIESKDALTTCTLNKRCIQDIEDIESRKKGGKKWIHKEITKEGGPKPDMSREWVPGYVPEEEEECQACGFPNLEKPKEKAKKDLWNLVVRVRRAENIFGTERLIRQREEAPSKRPKKKLTKIIRKRKAKFTEAYDKRELLKEERERANKEKKRKGQQPRKQCDSQESDFSSIDSEYEIKVAQK